MTEEIPTMRNPRRGAPNKGYKASLREASVADYTQLEKACLQAILTKQIDVILKVSYLTQWPDDFPQGIIIKQDGLVDYRKVKAKRLLKWLNDKGHSTITIEHIKVAGFQLTTSFKEIEGL